jgi:hypothetical protein
MLFDLMDDEGQITFQPPGKFGAAFIRERQVKATDTEQA